MNEKQIIKPTIEKETNLVPDPGNEVDLVLLKEFRDKYFIYDKILVWVPDEQNPSNIDSGKYDSMKMEMKLKWLPTDFVNTIIIDDYNFNNKTITQQS